MVSYCRSALTALMLAAGAWFVSADAVAAQFSERNWAYARYKNALPDSSVLTEYAGGTQEVLNPDVRFRVGFFPRFGCVPLISLYTDVNISSDLAGGQLLGSFNVPEFSIDRTPVNFPSLVEGRNDKVVVYYNGDEARRVKLRLQIDAGDNISFRLSNGRRLNFSLLGSRAVLEFAEEQCRAHVPG